MEAKRKEAYEIIQDLGTEFKVDIRKHFGKSYTQVSTEQLWQYINDNTEEQIEAINPEFANWIYDSLKDAASSHLVAADDIIVLADQLAELGARLHEMEIAD